MEEIEWEYLSQCEICTDLFDWRLEGTEDGPGNAILCGTCLADDLI